jgi:hypothetical protein
MRGTSAMREDKSQGLQEGDRTEGKIDSNVVEAAPKADSRGLKVPRRTRKHIDLLLIIGILVIAFGLWSGRGKNGMTTSQPATSPGSQAGDADLESTPEVGYATKGEWIETSGLWSKFGVLGAAFDGEKIVVSSAESAHGSLGCWISLRGRPLSGACSETGPIAGSKLSVGRTCSWQIVILDISQTAIRGARVLKTGDSDPGCAADYESRPSSFRWERPWGHRR